MFSPVMSGHLLPATPPVSPFHCVAPGGEAHKGGWGEGWYVDIKYLDIEMDLPQAPLLAH